MNKKWLEGQIKASLSEEYGRSSLAAFKRLKGIPVVFCDEVDDFDVIVET